jgi:hypothetical protein
LDCEKYTLAPSVVVDKARKLAEAGLYAQALEVLQRNCVEANVYPTHVEMSIPRASNKNRGFQKGNVIGNVTNKHGRKKPHRQTEVDHA